MENIWFLNVLGYFRKIEIQDGKEKFGLESSHFVHWVTAFSFWRPRERVKKMRWTQFSGRSANKPGMTQIICGCPVFWVPTIVMTFPEISKTSLEVVTGEGNARSLRATRMRWGPSGRGFPGRSTHSTPCSQTTSCPHPRLKEKKM